MSTLQFECIESDTSDMSNLPIAVAVSIDDTEYDRIMRRIFHVDAGTDTDVSAFNSSI